MDSFYYIAANNSDFKDFTLDTLLAAGYYRMQHIMFTCNDTALGENEPVVPVFWLRTLVAQAEFNKTAQKILKQSAHFFIEVQPAYVDDEIEALYALYKNHVQFSVSRSCNDYLHQEYLPNPFDSLMVQVRDEKKLIAAGYFDQGRQSIAGIMNIYHPQYQKYSLGKLLILQKIQYAIAQNKSFYYTGYMSPGSHRFDYKTFPDPAAIEIYFPDKKEWLPYQLFSKADLNEYFLKFLAKQV